MIKKLKDWFKKRRAKKAYSDTYISIEPIIGRSLTVLNTEYNKKRFRHPLTIGDALAPENIESVHMNMVTFDIEKLGYCGDLYDADQGEVWAMLQDIYFKILKEDPFWHFFYERFYIHIRCLDTFAIKVCDYLDDLGAVYTEPSVWIDGSDTVKSYHSVFTYLFHGFSVLAMESDENDFHRIQDRVIHCFMNHQWYKREFRTARELWGEHKAEAMLIAGNAIARANYEGFCEGAFAQDKYWRSYLDEQNKEWKKLLDVED